MTFAILELYNSSGRNIFLFLMVLDLAVKVFAVSSNPVVCLKIEIGLYIQSRSIDVHIYIFSSLLILMVMIWVPLVNLQVAIQTNPGSTYVCTDGTWKVC